MRKILAIDAGGTSSRAVVLDAQGTALGFGRSTGGNPTARGVDGAVSALAEAAQRALQADGSPTDSGSTALIALAGTPTPDFHAALDERFAALGIDGGVSVEPDLLGTYFSGTAEPDGYAMIVGTGSIAARITGGHIETVRGGSGWLLGDVGSGFWIGQRVATAAVAALDGLGPATALTALVLAELGIEPSETRDRGRPEALNSLVAALYAITPVELARFAPLAFRALPDAEAVGILTGAADALATLLVAVRSPGIGGAVVLGGSVIAAAVAQAPEIFSDRLDAVVGDADLIAVPDGVLGAAVMAFTRAGIPVDPALHAALRSEIERIQS